MYGGGDLEMVMYSFVRRLVAAGVAIMIVCVGEGSESGKRGERAQVEVLADLGRTEAPFAHSRWRRRQRWQGYWVVVSRL
jgi:LmbE family N-acetylglucosaminyl deacetylase